MNRIGNNMGGSSLFLKPEPLITKPSLEPEGVVEINKSCRNLQQIAATFHMPAEACRQLYEHTSIRKPVDSRP